MSARLSSVFHCPRPTQLSNHPLPSSPSLARRLPPSSKPPRRVPNPNANEKLVESNPDEALFYSKRPRPLASFKPNTKAISKNEKYVEMGKLAPDLMTDDLIAKRAQQLKVKQFADNIKARNKVTMKSKSEEERGEDRKAKRLREAETNPTKREIAEKYSSGVKKPPVIAKKPAAKVVPIKGDRTSRNGAAPAVLGKTNEQMTRSSKYGDFEGSLYDDESLGFDGHEGLEMMGGGEDERRGNKKRQGNKESLFSKLEAENESARLEVERLRAQFKL
jgi:hypothetical protein